MSTYYVSNNQFLGSISATEFSTAAANLRMMGAKFTTKKSGENFIVKFAFCPDFLRTHLLNKYAPKVEARATKRYWTTKAEYEAALRQAQGDTMSAQSLTQKADHKYRTRKPDPKSPHSAAYYNPLASLLTTPHFDKLNATQTNADLSEGVGESYKTTTVGITDMPVLKGRATVEDLMALTCDALYKLAQAHEIKGRYSLKGVANKPALAEKLVGLVRLSELSK
jgi:hypothetical protein